MNVSLWPLGLVIAACMVTVLGSTALHDAVLAGLSTTLPRMKCSPRLRLLGVMLSLFGAHMLEIGLYGLAVFTLIHGLQVGSLGGTAPASLASCLYFSAETFSSLGYGDLVPQGPLRLLAGVEALNGLLLIGWSASFTYMTMARYWTVEG
jgi:hypothetical protein